MPSSSQVEREPEILMTARQELGIDNGPLLTLDRILQPDGNSDSPRCNLGTESQQLIDLNPGDEVEVEIYQDGYLLIAPKDE